MTMTFSHLVNSCIHQAWQRCDTVERIVIQNIAVSSDEGAKQPSRPQMAWKLDVIMSRAWL